MNVWISVCGAVVPLVTFLAAGYIKMRTDIAGLQRECDHNRSDIRDEKVRNDHQDTQISQILQMLSRIDAGVKQLLEAQKQS